MPSPAPAPGKTVLDRTILVVEDEAPIADAVATRLRSEGFDVAIAADGPSGVAMCERLDRAKVPLTLLSQFLPRQHEAVREGRLTVASHEILREGVALALRPYLAACSVAPGAAS